MIVNYSGSTIIINTSNEEVDYSDINNFLPNKTSVILGDTQQAEFIPKKHTYILTEDCKYSGHFPKVLFKAAPSDPIIYVGIKRDEVVWFSKDDLLASDIDFGLVKLLNQSSPIMMIFHPWYVMLVYVVIILLMISAIMFVVLLVKKYNITF